MPWNALGERLSTFLERSTITADVGSLLLRPDADWTALEMLASKEWEETIVVEDATSFGFVPVGAVSLGAWLDEVDALPQRSSLGRSVGWQVRLETDARTEALMAALDALHDGLCAVALGIGARVARLRERPLPILGGFSGGVGVLTLSSPTPTRVLPVRLTGNDWLGLLPDGGLELFDRAAGTRKVLRRAEVTGVRSDSSLHLTTPAGELVVHSRFGRGDDQELWGCAEGSQALHLVEAHLAGEPVAAGSAGQSLVEAVPAPGVPHPQFIARVSAWLDEQLTGPEADALVPAIGGVRVQLWSQGLRLFFSPPASLPTALVGRHLARLETSLRDLGADGQPVDELRAALVEALPKVPAVARRAAGRLFVSTLEGARFDVVEHHTPGRAWNPRRREDAFTFTTFEAPPTFG